MDWDFWELCRRSAEARLLAYNFADGLLTISIKLYADERVVTVYLPTAVVQGVPLTTGTANHKQLTCCIYGTALKKHLTIRHGAYVPPAKFEQMIQEIRNGLYLAYGQRASWVKWYISVSGSTRFVGCLVRNIEDIWWEIKE